jgi:hypothetical protein
LLLTYVGDPDGIIVAPAYGDEVELLVGESYDFDPEIAERLLEQAPTKWQQTKAAKSGEKE